MFYKYLGSTACQLISSGEKSIILLITTARGLQNKLHTNLLLFYTSIKSLHEPNIISPRYSNRILPSLPHASQDEFVQDLQNNRCFMNACQLHPTPLQGIHFLINTKQYKFSSSSSSYSYLSTKRIMKMFMRQDYLILEITYSN